MPEHLKTLYLYYSLTFGFFIIRFYNLMYTKFPNDKIKWRKTMGIPMLFVKPERYTTAIIHNVIGYE